MEVGDQDYVLAAARLRSEADQLFRDTALLSLLATYGMVHQTGRYEVEGWHSVGDARGG